MIPGENSEEKNKDMQPGLSYSTQATYLIFMPYMQYIKRAL